jgi:hypothetical protein
MKDYLGYLIVASILTTNVVVFVWLVVYGVWLVVS